MGESDFIYNWKGLDKTNAKAFAIENSSVLDNVQFDNKLYIIRKHFNDIKLTIFDNNGNIKQDIVFGSIDNIANLTVKIKDFSENSILISINSVLIDIDLTNTQALVKKYDISAIDAFYYKNSKGKQIAVACNTQSAAELRLISNSGNISFISTLPASIS